MSDVRLSEIDHAGLVFTVADEGPPAADIVLLLHGFPERSTCWRNVTPPLHEAGFRTIAVDQRGYSPGARPRRRCDYTLKNLVADAAAVIDALGRPVHLVGHDWGAVVAWNLAASSPQHVRTLTAVSIPHPRAYLRSLLTSRQILKSWYIALFQLPYLPELLMQRQWMLRHFGMTATAIERFRTEIVDDGALPGALMWYRAMPFANIRHALEKVSVPTTLVWSDRDVAITRTPVAGTHRYVDAPYELVTLHDVSHWIPIEAPDALALAIAHRAQTPQPGSPSTPMTRSGAPTPKYQHTQGN
ncbi:alpha/beta fold hydrolase [Mycolicibacterium sp. CBMA 226]|uniref:alpha/beta fold hydrolase n=1 Tax=Mycolicibacterium sp. CBMA 226 TaxID=2606611 RepID=UPI0012DCF1FB|nr:alpha/beta fold hydrolase [Mycolicibacterium sp. CBMA 226]MUL78811.1 alpha/beta fold hydrolase [Mycolicibacterium sp. CBMA 226]QGW61106.1 Epoxide hydrolase A [Mycolicibacterium sp.]